MVNFSLALKTNLRKKNSKNSRLCHHVQIRHAHIVVAAVLLDDQLSVQGVADGGVNGRLEGFASAFNIAVVDGQ